MATTARLLSVALAGAILSACGGSSAGSLTPPASQPQAVPSGKPVFRWLPKNETLTYGAAPDTVRFEYAGTLEKPKQDDRCANYAPKEPRVTIKLKKTRTSNGDKYAGYALSARYGADGLSPYACTIVMTDASDKHLKATLKVHVTYPPAAPSLFVSDYTGGRILKYAIPLVADESPSAAFAVAPAGAEPIALSVASNGTVFYAANENDFGNVYIGACTSLGACNEILSIYGDGQSIAASGIAINAGGTSGYLTYSNNSVSGMTINTDAYVQPFSLTGTRWSFGVSPLAETAVPGSSAPIFPGFPITSLYGGAALDGNGDLAVALPFGLPSSGALPGVAVFPAGSSTPTYYKYGGDIAVLATAWVYGSNSEFDGLYEQLGSFAGMDFWFDCTVGTSTCGSRTGGFPVLSNVFGIAVDAQQTVYETSLGTLGGAPDPFPPVYGTQLLYATPFTSGSQVRIANNSKGQPFQAPWGMAIGP
jgi:hypothetical protein